MQEFLILPTGRLSVQVYEDVPEERVQSFQTLGRHHGQQGVCEASSDLHRLTVSNNFLFCILLLLLSYLPTHTWLDSLPNTLENRMALQFRIFSLIWSGAEVLWRSIYLPPREKLQCLDANVSDSAS